MVHATSSSDQPRSGQLGSEDADQLERAAADLWRKENPDMSVFSVTPEMKADYIRRIREGQ